MDWMRIIAELGGGGAVMSSLLNLAQGYRAAHQDMNRQKREENRKDISEENAAILAKMAKIEASDLGAWIHRFIVVVSMTIISSTVWGPLLTLLPSDHTVGVTWYWPTDYNFIIWSWEKIKEFTFGPEGATVVIGILPIHISMCFNIMGFYFVNRVFKRKM